MTREEAIRRLKDSKVKISPHDLSFHFVEHEKNEALDMAIKALEQEPRWIPVSERLPNDRDWYLGIFKESDTGWINPLPFICDYVGKETKATTKDHWILRGFTDRGELIDYYFNLECVAWMPIPTYKAESEDKE